MNDFFDLHELQIPHLDNLKTYIYFLYDGFDQVLYIGQTKNLYTRMGFHLDSKPNVKKIKYFMVSDEHSSEIEAELILRHSPIYNITIPTNNKYSSIERFQRKYICLKGKTNLIKKTLRQLNIKPLNGFYLIDDLLQMMDALDLGGK